MVGLPIQIAKHVDGLTGTSTMLLSALMVLLLGASTAIPSSAQHALRAQRSWINFGLGVSAYPTLTQFNWGINYHLQRSRLYQVGFNASGGLTFESTGSLHVALGRRLGRRFAQAAAFIGPAFVFGEERIRRHQPGASYTRWFYTGGIFADVQGLLLIPDIGLGLEIFSVVSLKNSTIGIRANFVYHR